MLAKVYNSIFIKEWNYDKNTLNPKDITCGSNKEVWWICEKGHEWYASPNNRRGCPYCSGYFATKENCFAEKFPLLLKEWDFEKNIIDPKNVSQKSNKKVWWICEKGHEWFSSIDSRAIGRNCPYCSGNKVCLDNCLLTVNPILSKEWNYNKNTLDPKDVVAFSHKKVWWVCENKHEWKTSIKHRMYGTGCPYCSNNKVCLENCLLTVNPVLSKEWDCDKNKFGPENVIAGSNKKAWWICDNGHSWKAIINSRNRGAGCLQCVTKISKIGTSWLDSLNIPFENREITININGKYIVADAYFNNTIYEFYGDFWHGNPKVFKKTDLNPVIGKTYGYLYNKTLKKELLIKSAGFDIISIWEHDFKNNFG